MIEKPVLQHTMTRARMLKLMAVGATAVPALHFAGVVAQDATPIAATPVATPVGGTIQTRRNAKTLSATEKAAFTDAILAIKTTPSPWDANLSTYDQFVLWHRDAFACDLMAAHMGPAFFPWHRMFLRLFEQQLQRVDPGVTLPYWDWTIDNTSDSWLWQDDFMGGTGDPEQDYAVTDGPFRKGAFEITIFDEADDERLPHLIRDLGVGELAPDLPTAEEVETSLEIPAYDAAPWNELTDPTMSFRNYLEGWRGCIAQSCAIDPTDHPNCPGDHLLHNRVHLWVSGEFAFAHQGGHEKTVGPLGTMAMNSSPNDPVFFLHHANIDRLWNEWMRRHGQVYAPESGAIPGHNLNDPMWPYDTIGMTVTPAMMLDSSNIGYDYDTD